MIVGDGDEGARLRQQAVDLGVDQRVTFLGAVGDAALLEQLARCRAVCFPASQEDYGLVTVEAFASSKPVITCSDSGGPAELVTNDENGFVTAPDARALATALASVTEQLSLAERLGAAARRQVDAFTWERTIRQLLLV